MIPLTTDDHPLTGSLVYPHASAEMSALAEVITAAGLAAKLGVHMHRKQSGRYVVYVRVRVALTHNEAAWLRALGKTRAA